MSLFLRSRNTTNGPGGLNWRQRRTGVQDGGTGKDSDEDGVSRTARSYCSSHEDGAR